MGKFININSKMIKDTLEQIHVSDFENAGISIDSRTIKNNDIFFAIKGNNFDGHDYIASAFDKGAICAIIDNIKYKISEKTILVKNSTEALKTLGLYIKEQISPKIIIGITGSIGKTTTKNWLAQMLDTSHNIFKSIKNYNTKYGIPISLTLMPKSTEIGIFELGTSAPNQISELSNYLQPNIAMITNIYEAHIGSFQDKQELAKEKISILDGMSPGGTIIFNADSEFINLIKKHSEEKKINTISVGFSDCADFFIQSFDKHKVILKTPDQTIEYETSFDAKHMAYISACVVACMHAIGLKLQPYLHIMKNLEPLNGRGKIETFTYRNKNLYIINDAYNASPQSMIAAIDVLQNMSSEKQRKIAIIGQMLELGNKEKAYHQKIAKQLQHANINFFFVGGKHLHNIFLSAIECFEYINSDVIEKILKSTLHKDIILLKGSNSIKLDQIVHYIKSVS